MKLGNRKLVKRKQVMGIDMEGVMPILNVFSVVGLILFGMLIVPALIGMISAVPDIMRYLRIKSM